MWKCNDLLLPNHGWDWNSHYIDLRASKDQTYCQVLVPEQIKIEVKEHHIREEIDRNQSAQY